MKNRSVFLLFLILCPLNLFSQDEVLLTIDGQPVKRSEFERIYHKNSNVQGYEAKSPAEYLDMFVNFKLKVLEARKLGYDTLPSFINELAGYREQLSKPYLQDRSLIDKLVQEAYYRTANEVNASHIMVKLPANPAPSDTFAAYNKAMEIRKRLVAGESFDKIAREESEDPSGRINGGSLGWFSAFTMVYPFENAAYNTKVGEYSMPVRSKYGYHIIRVNDVRPSLGEIRLAHIMVRSGRNDDPASAEKSKEKIDSCYKLLLAGSTFSDMVKKYSEDAGSSRNGGQMRWLRSGELPSEIEDKVFALRDSGSFTAPIKSEFGWHIFQLLGKRPVESFDQLKSQLEERILMDERGKQTEDSFMNRVKKECNYREYPDNISMIADVMDSSVYNGTWNSTAAGNLMEPVCTINNRDYTQKELVDFITRTKRYNPRENYLSIVNRKFKELVSGELMNYEKARLEEKYPAFKYMMDEYHDGILLFNIMDDKVWNKAVTDTAGLKAFYAQHAGEYRWLERADISIYTVNDPAFLKNTLSLAKKRAKMKWSADEIVKNICGNDTLKCVSVADLKVEQGESLPLNGFTWKKGYVKTVHAGNQDKILFVNDIIPPMQKAFDEIQGQVTADYQNYLDKQWIETLRAKYPVVVNRDVLQLVK